MNLVKIIGIVLLVGGVLGLVYGGFTYTRATHDASIGPVELKFTYKERVNIPIWAGVGAIAVGGMFLFFGGGKR